MERWRCTELEVIGPQGYRSHDPHFIAWLRRFHARELKCQGGRLGVRRLDAALFKITVQALDLNGSGAAKREPFEEKPPMRILDYVPRALSMAALVLIAAAAVVVGTKQGAMAGEADPWLPTQLITPEDLVKQISDRNKPLVICVAFKVLYDVAHVPGALYFGPGRDQRGLDALKQWAQSQPKDRRIAIYCGCCPWSHCPNVRPAFALLKDMGFTRLQLVKIENNFGSDWRDKGFPVESAQ